MDYTIAEDYELPSKGLIYEKPVNPHVRLRSMTVRDEMKRRSSTNTPYKVLSEIIESCMLEKPAISVYDMALGDYEYLLHKLRVVTYGPKYKMTVGCPHCGEVYDATVDLDELAVREFSKDEFEKATSFTLPASGKSVVIKYQTPRMLDTIEVKVAEFKKKNKEVTIDPTPLITLQYMIDLVDGRKLDYTELETFITNLPARDFNFIMNKSKKIADLIGLDTSIDVTCNKCGGNILTFFRFGQEFFRPSEDE